MKEKKPKKKAAKPKRNSYICPHCNKQFQDNSSWQTHVSLHSSDYPYECELCSYKCKIKKYLSRHVKSVHTKRKGPHCTVCGKTFHFECNLKSHMLVHTGEKPFKCDVCSKEFRSTYTLSVHKLIHSGEKPYECAFCDYRCRDNSTIRKHQERHMGITKNYPCSICNKNFKKKQTLQIHVDEVHFELDTRKYPCTQCDKIFKTKNTLQAHRSNVHSVTNRVKCEICGVTATKNNLHAHMRRHIDVYPYKCSYKPCGKRFKDKGDLKKHSRIHYPEKQFQCTLCARKFARKERLNKHISFHKYYYNVQCDYCRVMFKNKLYLSWHMKKEHGPHSKKFICDECGIVVNSKTSIIKHLRYGHGKKKDTKCHICDKNYKSHNSLKLHYLKYHNIHYVVPIKEEDLPTIKQEPEDELYETQDNHDPPQFVYQVEIQKHERDELHENTEFDSNVDLSPDCTPNDVQSYPIDADTITYSKKVLSEDISRSLIERHKETPGDAFEDFFIGHVLKKPEDIIDIPKEIVDEKKKEKVEQCLEKLLNKIRVRKETKTLEKLRRKYNKRIKMATSKGIHKKEPKSIRYFKNTEKIDKAIELDPKNNDHEIINDIDTNNGNTGENNNTDTDKIVNNDQENLDNDEAGDINDKRNSKEGNNVDKIDNNDKETIDNDNIEEINDKTDTEESKEQEVVNNNDKIIVEQVKTSQEDTNTEGDDKQSSDEAIGDDDDDYKASDEEMNGGSNKNGKLTFHTHQCYICFQLFKTKMDLKRHCTNHFDLCNDKMLKKCPFCGYVTNLQIQRHIKLVHKVSLEIPYSHIKERNTKNGSKYVYEIDKDVDLEIIPSVSNLNKIASMRIDEKNRENKNIFLGTTKLVRKGGDWVVEKQAMSVSNEYLLPKFSKDDYNELKSVGSNYIEKLKNLSEIAKKKGLKILYPCEGCEKICLTLSALKLHDRKHQDNPKAFKPKVWKHKLNGNNNNKVKKRPKKRKKDIKNATDNVTKANNSSQSVNSTKINKTRRLKVVNKNDAEDKVPNRLAAPNPVKNKHKCDKELIEFYKNNIKGGDIEFWQFLKIFNKMTRENVNDFKDLENRQDFGMHIEINNTQNVKDKDENAVKNTKKIVKRKVNKSIKFTRSIMISKKEYLRRIELKNEMRKRMNESSKM